LRAAKPTQDCLFCLLSSLGPPFWLLPLTNNFFFFSNLPVGFISSFLYIFYSSLFFESSNSPTGSSPLGFRSARQRALLKHLFSDHETPYFLLLGAEFLFLGRGFPLLFCNILMGIALMHSTAWPPYLVDFLSGNAEAAPLSCSLPFPFYFSRKTSEFRTVVPTTFFLSF